MRRLCSRFFGLVLSIFFLGALSLGLACLSSVNSADAARVDENINTGNPFENGDFRWDSNTQTYRLAGLSIRVGDISMMGSSENSGPFAYPESLKKAYELYLNGEGGGNFGGWGYSTFSYGSVKIQTNSRNLSFSSLPTWGWCAQPGNDITVSLERDARLILVEENSYWSNDGSSYHACFVLLVDNAHEYGIWDQATIGGEYVYATWEVYGWAKISKQSSLPSLSENNSSYQLEGARYGIYTSRDDASAQKNVLAELVCDAEGNTTEQSLSPGTYYVREIDAPRGYALDEEIYEVVVKASQTTTLETKDIPQSNPVDLLVRKADQDRGEGLSQGNASLAKAQFLVEFYGGFFTSAAQARASGDPLRTWTIETDAKGQAYLSPDYLVEGDRFYYNSKGEIVLPLGTVLIQEIKSPTGYVEVKDANVYLRTISSEGSAETVEQFYAPLVSNEVIRGGVLIQKLDAELGTSEALGGASLEGALFRIYNASDQAVIVQGKEIAVGEPVQDLITDENGIAQSSADLLPYGRYEVVEITAPDGYLSTDLRISFSIDTQGQVVELKGENTFSNQVKRGDICFRKKNGASSTALAFVPFRITSETTGESHIIVTDENGYASSEASWNPHSQNTNANDEASEGQWDTEAGIWFSGRSDRETQPNDELGALPYDTYTIEELPCSANEGLQLIVQTGVTISRDMYCVDLGTIDDPQASLGTSARDASDADHIVYAGATAQIIDRVSYAGLIPGRSYTLIGSIVDPNGGEVLDFGSGEISAQLSFIPESPNGSVELSFDLSSSLNLLPSNETGEINLVVYEELWCDGRLIAEHKDPNDSGQSIQLYLPEISTQASDGYIGGSALIADPRSYIVDTLSYSKFLASESYRVVTAAFCPEDAQDAQADMLDNALASTQTTFVASPTGNGSIDISFICDTTSLEEGESIVIFEWVFDSQNNLIAQHVDKDDPAQTLNLIYPQLDTSARDAQSGTHTLIDDGQSEVQILDTVSYQNLIPGLSYQLESYLLDAATGEALRDESGEVLTFLEEFVPQESTGSIEVSFSFDPSELPSNSVLVSCQRLIREEFCLLEHADLNDKEQSISISRPLLHTTASDGADGDKFVLAQGNAVIQDEVSLENIIAEQSYTIYGLLMDKSTGLPLISPVASEEEKEELSRWWELVEESFADFDLQDALLSQSIEAEVLEALKPPDEISDLIAFAEYEFLASDENDQVSLEFSFDASALADGSELVVFEMLINTDSGRGCAIHADWEDENQSVSIEVPVTSTSSGEAFDQTGANILAIAGGIIGLALGGSAIFFLGKQLRKRRLSARALRYSR